MPKLLYRSFDALNSTEIVVLAGSTPWTAMAFERSAGGRALRFARQSDQIVDEETGSVWDVSGTALSGPLAGERLPFADSLVNRWFAWASYRPQTDIFQP